MKLVYLAGPITGMTWNGATSWRDYAREKLAPFGIEGLSPLRAKHYIARHGADHEVQQTYDEHPLSTQKGITTRDRFDCTRADVVLVNLIGASDRSIGSILELGWADAFRRPTVLAIEPSGNCHDHPMVREVVGFRTATLDEALDVAVAILSAA